MENHYHLRLRLIGMIRKEVLDGSIGHITRRTIYKIKEYMLSHRLELWNYERKNKQKILNQIYIQKTIQLLNN